LRRWRLGAWWGRIRDNWSGGRLPSDFRPGAVPRPRNAASQSSGTSELGSRKGSDRFDLQGESGNVR
jgi:hypothetical protein